MGVNNLNTRLSVSLFPSFIHKIENSLGIAALLLMTFLPVLELILRTFFKTGLMGSTEIVQHLSLWAGFIGVALTSREGLHLSLSSGISVIPKKCSRLATTITNTISTTVSAALTWASFQLVLLEKESAATVGGFIPTWIVESILPISFLFVTIRFIWSVKDKTSILITATGLLIAYIYGFHLEPYASILAWPAISLLLLSAFSGTPIFILLGGAALILFFATQVPVAAIPVETYRIVVSPSIPAIPLFTLTGFILAESKTSDRLVNLFKALFGWIPGGLILSTTLVCTFFSTFTGASGVTILALGALLLPVLINNGYSEKFSIGIITSTGSIGLLFPPSLAVILYGVIAHVPIPDLFKAGIIPGVLMVAVIALYGTLQEKYDNIERQRFNLNEIKTAIVAAKFEIILPIIIIVSMFGGYTTLIETAALAAAYVFIIETFVYRDIHLFKDMPGILVKCLVMLGGIFVIFGVAMGLTNFLVDAMIPMKAAEWVQNNIESKYIFLIALNIFLIIVGSLMDIFSAIVIVVPLIIPIAELYSIHPLHLGMIFLLNLELGFLTPPVGMNLFLASYRLDKPLITVYKSALPFLLLLLGVVLLVTYIPWLVIGT